MFSTLWHHLLKDLTIFPSEIPCFLWCINFFKFACAAHFKSPRTFPYIITKEISRLLKPLFQFWWLQILMLLLPLGSLWTLPSTSAPVASSGPGTSLFFHPPSSWCCSLLGFPHSSQLQSPAPCQPTTMSFWNLKSHGTLSQLPENNRTWEILTDM